MAVVTASHVFTCDSVEEADRLMVHLHELQYTHLPDVGPNGVCTQAGAVVTLIYPEWEFSE